MLKLLYLLAGGAIGTVARYGVSGLTHKLFEMNFPLGTLLVNLSGSLLIGLVWGLWENNNISNNTRTFIFIGIFGGYTTFSSYALETLNLFQDGETRLALFNILASNILGLAMIFLGYIAAKYIINFSK